MTSSVSWNCWRLGLWLTLTTKRMCWSALVRSSFGGLFWVLQVWGRLVNIPKSSGFLLHLMDTKSNQGDTTNSNSWWKYLQKVLRHFCWDCRVFQTKARLRSVKLQRPLRASNSETKNVDTLDAGLSKALDTVLESSSVQVNTCLGTFWILVVP